MSAAHFPAMAWNADEDFIEAVSLANARVVLTIPSLLNNDKDSNRGLEKRV